MIPAKACKGDLDEAVLEYDLSEEQNAMLRSPDAKEWFFALCIKRGRMVARRRLHALGDFCGYIMAGPSELLMHGRINCQIAGLLLDRYACAMRAYGFSSWLISEHVLAVESWYDYCGIGPLFAKYPVRTRLGQFMRIRGVLFQV